MVNAEKLCDVEKVSCTESPVSNAVETNTVSHTLTEPLTLYQSANVSPTLTGLIPTLRTSAVILFVPKLQPVRNPIIFSTRTLKVGGVYSDAPISGVETLRLFLSISVVTPTGVPALFKLSFTDASLMRNWFYLTFLR